MKVSDRCAAMQFSPIRRFNTYAFEAEDQGKKVYRLNIGQPDIETPKCFKEAIDNFDQKVIAYAESGGVTELLDAMIGYMKRDYGMEYERKDVLITNGGSEALVLAFTAVLNPGDEVIIAEPFYTNYNTFCNEVSGVIVPITTHAEDGYNWAKRDLIEAAITPKTKAICCLSPGNPTGRVLTLEDMKLIGDIAKEHDLWIISDEVYREFAYDGESHSFGQLDDIADRVIIVDSVSKRWSACGARIGAVICKNKDFQEAVLKLAQGRLCVPTLEQVGAAALYRMDPSYYDEAKAEYQARRDAAYEELSKIPGIVCQKPAGSFYMMCKLPVDNIEDFLMFLLKEFDDKGETAMFAPAPGFYATPGLGGNEMRIAYVLSPDKMRRACEIIKLGVEAYNNR